VPVDGEHLLAGVPTLVSHFPGGTTVDRKTPIVLTFSESLAPNTVNIAFQLSQEDFTGSLPVASALVGDGHMVILYPLTDLLPAKTYSLSYRENVVLTDRTGQAVFKPADLLIGSFTTATTEPIAPTVVATWPPDLATGVSTTSEIDVVFSRPMDPTSVDTSSFVVTTDGVPPIVNPVPLPVTITTQQGSVPDTRAFRYKILDGAGNPVPFGTLAEPLGTGANVRVELSPTGHPIRELPSMQGGTPAVLANKVFTFTTATFSPPLGAEITEGPPDAIGIDQISGPSNLAIRVDLADAADGDRLGVYLFGKQPGVAQNANTIALLREFDLEPPFTEFTITALEIDLVSSASPLAARFQDGSVNMAFYVKRGTVVSPVRLLDVDAVTKGVQAPILDTVRPTLQGLGTSGNVVSTFRSDMRDVVLVGRASEALRAARVTTRLGTNEIEFGTAPPVVGSHSSGLFIAAPVRTRDVVPVPVGVLDPMSSPLDYTLEIFDRALNTATAVSGQFTQVAAASNGTPGPFADVTVDVVNSVTLAPVAGASVYVHENFRGDFSLVGPAVLTDVTGRAVVSPALFGDTIVTVDARSQGFDLFTFDGVPTDHVGIPLRPTALLNANVAGALSTTDVNIAGPVYSRAVADTRFPTPGETLLPVPVCSPITIAQPISGCPFGPAPILARKIGAESAIVVRDPSSAFEFSALTYLKAFQISLPIPPADPGASQPNTLSITQVLDAGTLDPEERPIDVAPRAFITVDYPMLAGQPRVRVEARTPGLDRAVTVGRGLAFSDLALPDTYGLRAAYPGSADGIQDVPSDELGSLVTKGTIEADLMLRAEVLDTTGNRAGVRPRLSSTTLTLIPPAPPAAIGFAATASALGVELSFADVIPDAAAEPGLYRVTLVDTTGLSWTIWRLDAPDAAGPNAIVHLPRIGAGDTLPVAPGNLRVRISAFAWPGLDVEHLMWTDVEREHDLFAHAVEVMLTPP
jgi:hypothetical protein